MYDLAETGVGRVQERAQAFLDEQPQLYSGSIFYWRAFQELNTERPIGLDGNTKFPVHIVSGAASGPLLIIFICDLSACIFFVFELNCEIVKKMLYKAAGTC